MSHYSHGPNEQEIRAFDRYSAEDEKLILVTGFGSAYLRNRFSVGVIFPGGIFLLLGIGLAMVLDMNLGYGLLLGLIGACVVGYLKVKYISASNKYMLTTRRVIIKQGLLTASITSALFDKITHIDIDQSFFDKFIMREGNIIINTAGTNSRELVLSHVAHPVELKNLIEKLINRERQNFGIQTGSVQTLEGELIDE